MKKNQYSIATNYNRYPEIFSEISKLETNPKKILSFGCSTGEECNTLSDLYFKDSQITGIDWFQSVINKNILNNKNENIYYKYKLDTNDKFDLIFCMSVLCAWPENEKIIYDFNTFEETLIELDKHLNINGYICIYNSKYLFEETRIFNKYKIIKTNHKETGFVTKYYKNNEKLATSYEYYLFQKIAN